MSQISVTIPADLLHHIDGRVADGGFDGPAAYLRALAERDRDAYRTGVVRVQALIDDGIAAGVCDRDAFGVIDAVIAGVPTPHG